MYLEHANITVEDIDQAIIFLQTAFPNFQVRGGGGTGNERWLHIGTDKTYIALNAAYGKATSNAYNGIGINHIGFVVQDVNSVQERLEGKGYQSSYPRTEEKYRTRIYYNDPSGNEYEFVEYLSEDPQKRNFYKDQ
ncbi:VOC family protein [Candidatus Uabimicrobium sp. HlEnr_7]|uniref:VOC family protein n=1 Tax=Candidatus Uabimicrobium helgolandensis TaxID=3095367 RepID=UPI0035560526